MAAPVDQKPAVRRRHLAARQALTAAQLVAAAEQVVAHLLGVEWVRGAATVAAYVPMGTEPGGAALLPALRAHVPRLLLPIVVSGEALDWAGYDGTFTSGPIGLSEPAGHRLGAGALFDADVVLVPGLAVDRRGFRLGRGAGYYDRSLPLIRPGVPLVALLHDGELLKQDLPAESHDVPVTHVVTPAGGVVAVG